MATVQKSSKINFYKFVQVKDPSGSANPAVKDSDIVLAKSINTNTLAINNLGETVNSLGKVLVDLKKVSLSNLEAQRAQKTKFKAEYTKPQKQKQGGLVSGLLSKSGSFLEGLLNLFGGLFKLAVIIPVLKWLGDEKNQKALVAGLEVIKTVVKFIADWAKFSITTTIDGLYDLFKDDASWQERLLGFGKAVVGIGSIVLGLRYLRNPTKIITDIAKGVRSLISLIRGRRGGRLGRRGGGLAKIAVGATVATTAVMGINALNNKDGDEEFAQGGSVKNLPSRAQGGFINGPQSGYPVSLDGGRSTSFIGHGREYVARKSNGGAFVVPLNTPGTKTQPHLTSKRMGEAQSQGFDIGGMVNAFQGGFNPGKGFNDPMSQNVMPSFAPESKFMSQGGGLPSFANGGGLNKQIYMHWTAGGYNWKNGPYHTTVQGNGDLYKHKPYDQHTAHTYYRNTGNVGLSVAAMKDYNWNSFAPKPKQLEAMTAEAAVIAKGWGWKPGDVSIRNVMTHAEAASNKDGRSPHDNYGPTWWGGTGERSDLHKLKGSDKDGTGGDKLRQMMKKYMGMKNPPILNESGPGAGGAGGPNGQLNSGEYNLLQRLVLAEAGGEGKLGMALVARSVLNRAGLIQSNKVGPGMFMAKDKSVTGVIMGRRQYQPVEDGSINDARSSTQMAQARDAIEMARNTTSLRGNLEAEGMRAENINYLMGSTGFRTGSAFNDESQNVNVVKYKNHFFNTAGNASVKTHIAEIENGGTGGGIGAGDYGSSYAANSGFDMDGGRTVSSGGKTILGNFSAPVAGQRRSDQKYTYGNREAEIRAQGRRGSLSQSTQQRNDARSQITERTREMVGAVMEQVGQANNMNAEMVAAASSAVQNAMAASRPGPPVVVGGGGGGGGSSGGGLGGALVGTAAALLGSTNNPLKGIFK
ncbi:hypothetical protein RW220110_013 [Cyanophage S-RIM12_RW_22_0110]|uniref:Uncharacterized protein n=1 Tax=Cyanophage S-RIM12 TaxID=1278402 RepID=A0A1D7STG0_9CAUD|nr:hypothetical protein RW220110_013 [Cyanophage S-RIM12_RW_22_0110]